jgi:hypothetical protein
MWFLDVEMLFENIYWDLSRILSSVVHCTAATGRRFRCDIVLGKNEYLYESLVGCMSLRITVWILFCSRIGLSKKIYSKISL